MTASAENIAAILLDMIGSASRVDGAALAAFTDQHWQQLDMMARQHRLQPLLHSQKQSVGSGWPVPQWAVDRWHDANRQAAMRALNYQSVLVGITRTLGAEGIEFAALKGAWLAWNAYPNPAVRTMRDIDIVVDPAKAMDAFAALDASGLKMREHQTVPIEFALANHKHLPPLWAAKQQVAVELHTRLVEIVQTRTGPDSFDNPVRLLANSDKRDVAGVSIPYLAATDTLLHIIIHSAYDHRFNNGPMVLNDIAGLLSRFVVEWPRFWAMAADGGWTRGCALLFDLTERYHGQLPIDWLGVVRGATPDAVLDDAAQMMLQDGSQRGTVALWTEIRGASGIAALWTIVATRFNMPRHVIMAYNGAAADAPWRWWYFPKWVVGRGWQMVRGAFDRRVRADASRGATADQWMNAAA